MKLLFFLLVTLLSEEVLMAPLKEGKESEGEGHQECKAPDSKEKLQEELDEMLKQALLSNKTGNLEKIKKAFTFQPNEVKLRVQVEYSINCTDWGECVTDFNCSDGFNRSFTWTSINPSSLSGRYLLGYAALNWEFFGFEWMGACNTSVENTLHLQLEVLSLTPLCGVREGMHFLNESLKSLTIQVSYTLMIALNPILNKFQTV